MIKKIVILILLFELSGCSGIGKPVEANVEAGEESGQFNIESEETLTADFRTSNSGEGGSEAAHSHSNFALAEMTPLPDMTPIDVFRICSPLASVPLNELSTVVSDPYKPPLKGSDERHQGVDFAFYRRYDRASIAGEKVQSVYKGKIAGVVEDKFPYGNAVIIETSYNMLSAEMIQKLGIKNDQSVYTLYGHLNSMTIKTIGEAIAPCQFIAVVGKSGNAGVEHLHLEMRIGPSGEKLPSMSYYVRAATPAEREAYLRWRTGNEFVHFDPMKFLDMAS